MKLINKFTLWYLSIVLTCTVVGTAITYHSIKSKIDNTEIDRLKTINHLAYEQISSGSLKDSLVEGRKVSVHLVDGPLPNKTTNITKVKTTDLVTQKKECSLAVSSFFTINGKTYGITSYEPFSKTDEILSGLAVSILWKWLLILSLIAITGRYVSRLVLSPFNKTLKAIEFFNVRQKEKIQLPVTNTREFKNLNSFVKDMTDRVMEEYSTLKEFTENASHELQTPVAVMGGKLELLAESAITKEQALLITDIQGSLERLSRINSSLILLTRLENHEYETTVPLHFCRLINDSLAGYRELIEMKSLTLTKNVAEGVYVALHPILGNLLLNNLFSNAIRHNIPNGRIDVQMTSHSLTITNTGGEPPVPTSELFQRFKKGNQCSQSIGIGLAIVKQISDIHGFHVEYTYENGLHILELQFDAVQPEEPILQVAEPALQLQHVPAYVPQPAIY